MKVLKIENGKGLFINPRKINEKEDLNNQYKVIDQITKEDILDILDYLLYFQQVLLAHF